MAQDQPKAQRHTTSVKETLTSIVIAFVMAFVFRSFVIEAFVIPTGSMAPTLMGAHMRFRGPETGLSWQVGPWRHVERGGAGIPTPTQPNVKVHDPNLVPWPEPRQVSPRQYRASEITATKPILSGDRILVFKYLPPLLSPQRFDICVFKYPGGPEEAYIKRLLGLPGEQVALVDGDVFVRPLAARPGGPDGSPVWGPTREQLALAGGTWELPGWEIARKPERVQREVWQPVYEAKHAPMSPVDEGGVHWFEAPWEASGGWSGLDSRSYIHSGAGAGTLAWRTEAWPIVDWYPYNENDDPAGGGPRRMRPYVYNVGDVRIHFGFEPQAEEVALTAGVATRRHEFRAVLDGAEGKLEMRPAPDAGKSDAPWQTLATAELDPAAPGRVREIEFWHVDQSVSLYVDGQRVAHAPYDWRPPERIEAAIGASVEQILLREETGVEDTLLRQESYAHPATTPVITVSGPAALHRLGVDRDIYYQPGSSSRSAALRGAHPREKLVILNQDQFFTCGDNSPASSDGRMWEDVAPWVAQVDDTAGIVPRSLMVGRAFFVYFPSLHKEGGLPAPDFGRLRFLY